MSTVNVLAKEIAAKLVFYGPGLSGKTTSLKKVYESVKPSNRGELMSLPTESDRTLFFDFLPVRVERVGDYSVRLALYTVPGQVFYNATRKLVLQGADGVVFVADSQREAEDANRESLNNLQENLAEQGVDLGRFPMVFQYNKRDLPTAMSVADLRKMLNPRGVPDFETCATSGMGVLDALKASIRLVIRDLKARKVVPPARPSRPPEPERLAADATGPSLAGQIAEALERHDARAPVHPPLATPSAGLPKVISALPPPPPPMEATLGPAAALAPSALLDYARAADAAYATQDWEACIRACLDGAKRGLAYAGEGSLGGQAYLLRVDGGDVLHLEALAQKAKPRVDDAAFALMVICQVFNRLSEAGLPPRAG
jgi:signal recognition particle receptor subunit beta